MRRTWARRSRRRVWADRHHPPPAWAGRAHHAASSHPPATL